MFNCSRSDFAKDNCSFCCRLYIDELFRPTNFNIKLDFDFFSTEFKDYFIKIDILKLILVYFMIH